MMMQSIWATLDKIHLKEFISQNSEKLNAFVSENGQNLSVGQRQLICLGRALLKKNNTNAFILIMDEATASIDVVTDSFIQETIREQFQDATVLTIAHRLNTILDYDRILVLDSGKVTEFDSPSVLSKRGGLFASMLANLHT